MIRDGWSLAALERAGEGGGALLRGTLREEATGREETLEPFLVVGADGLRSKVPRERSPGGWGGVPSGFRLAGGAARGGGGPTARAASPGRYGRAW